MVLFIFDLVDKLLPSGLFLASVLFFLYLAFFDKSWQQSRHYMWWFFGTLILQLLFWKWLGYDVFFWLR